MSNKVTKINVHVIKCDLTQPFAFSQGWVKKRSSTLVEIAAAKRNRLLEMSWYPSLRFGLRT